MPTVSITEGQVNSVNSQDTLEYPGLNSCLSITTVFPDLTRRGGHALLIPEQGQKTLQAICDYIQDGPGATQLYIIGEVGTWNQNWPHLPQCRGLTINGQQIRNVREIATALGYQNAVIFDIINAWGVATYNLYFGFDQGARSLWGENTATQQKVYIPQHGTW